MMSMKYWPHLIHNFETNEVKQYFTIFREVPTKTSRVFLSDFDANLVEYFNKLKSMKYGH